jgi:hypothetical protein
VAGSRCDSIWGPYTLQLYTDLVPSRTPSPMGILDAGDPDVEACPGDTPGPLGIFDHADPAIPGFHFIPLLNYQRSQNFQIFEESVLDAHVKRAERRRHRVENIPESELEIVEGKFKLRKAAARKCRELLIQARAHLATEKAAFLKKPKADQAAEERNDKKLKRVPILKVHSIGISSAYRPFEHDSALWHEYFREKYYPTNYSRLSSLSRWEGGRHGWKAERLMVDFIAKRKAAPGFSNHTSGIAVDFVTAEGKETLQAETGHSNTALKSHNQRWERSWLYRWLEGHKDSYGIERIETEAWHWEFHELNGSNSQAAKDR